MNRLKNNDQLIKVMSDQQHLRHVLTQDHIRQMMYIESRYNIAKAPVCASCERVGLWGKNRTGHCLHCGTITTNPISLSEYYTMGYDLDGATGKDRAQVRHERNARKVILPDKVKT